MNISQLITGTVMVGFGVFLLFKIFPEDGLGSLIFGGMVIVLGLFILFNAREDKIEQIKNDRCDCYNCK